MTNEEKTKALVDELGIIYTDCERATIKELLMEMAEWKEEQFAKEKQALIDKACEWVTPYFKDLVGYNCSGGGKITCSAAESEYVLYNVGDTIEVLMSYNKK